MVEVCFRYSVMEEKAVDFMDRNLAHKRHKIWGLRGSSDVKGDLKVSVRGIWVDKRLLENRMRDRLYSYFTEG